MPFVRRSDGIAEAASQGMPSVKRHSGKPAQKPFICREDKVI
jgi:hypothetical protein